jgi:multiple sugar transport system permease protein
LLGGGKRAAALLLLAPGVLLFAVFVIYPIAASFVLSLQSWNGLGPKTWIGLGNYAELFTDPVFYRALANNLLWLALSVLAPVLGLGIAVLVNQAFPGIRIVRALFFLPFVISAIVVGMVFGWFFNAEFGLLNALLAPLGTELAPLDSEDGAIFAVIAAALWPQTAYCAILYLTGLMSLQPELIDAARIDGARGLRLLWQIVLPQMAPVNFIVALVCVVSALRGFDMVVIMTGGGPYDSSTVLAHYMYEQTFHASRYGFGAAIACVLFALMAAGVSFFLWRMLRREAA